MKWINQDKLVRFSKNTRSKDVRSELEVLSYSHKSFSWTDTITIFDYALVFILFLPNSDFLFLAKCVLGVSNTKTEQMKLVNCRNVLLALAKFVKKF